MIGRRKKSFYALCELLRGIESEPSNVQEVLKLNKMILREVLRAEQNIRRHRETRQQLRSELKIGRKSREQTDVLRKRIARVERYIEGYFDQIYIWKCFGDGLAFAYLDRFSVKHAFFDVESIRVKPEAGMLSGKPGLRSEIDCLLMATQHKIPAVLCDITNVIRYGDVCLLDGPDPYPIEVKSNGRLNQRGKRQVAALQKLTEFLETDCALNFRGAREVRRSSVHIPERTHIDVLNRCIAEAQQNGHAAKCPVT